MHVRCPQCRKSTWVTIPVGRAAAQGDDQGAETGLAFDCKGCGAPHRLQGISDLGATPEERHARGVEYADRHGVDLASAFSTLLGLMPTPAMAVSPDDPDAEAGADADTPAGEEPAQSVQAGSVGYDSGFRRAVSEGLLTPEQARDLGDRSAAAARLARSHHLPPEFALDVVDHRMSLYDAVQRAPVVRTRVPVKVVPANNRQKALVLSLFALACAAIAVFAWNRWAVLEGEARSAEVRTAEASNPSAEPPVPGAPAGSPIEPSPRTDSPPAEVQTDEEGRPLRITARSPRAVLDAFCDTGEGAGLGRYRPEDVVTAAHGSRLGLVRDLDNLDRALSILIRHDRSTGRWSAGNGLEPIVVGPPPGEGEP